MVRKRRGRGEGSVFQRADGLWVTSVSLGYAPSGRRRRKTLYGKTKTEVLGKLKDFDPQRAAADGTLTVGGYLTRWVNRVKPTVELTSWDGYDQHCRLHIAPRLGHVRLSNLTAAHVEDLRDGLLADGVSPALTKKVLVTLRTAMNAAVKLHQTPANVAQLVDLPRVPRYLPRVFTPVEVSAFIAAAAADRLEALYLVAIDSGYRQGELLALRWPDFDSKSNSVTVTKALANRAGKTWVKDVKTDRSRRSVVLGLSLDALARHRERMRTEGRDVVSGVIFCDTEGGHLKKENIRRRHFHPTLRQAGLPLVRFHDLRHCCASLLLLAGEDTKVVSERLGHSNPGFTASVYQHVLPGLQARAAARLKALLTPPAPEPGAPGKSARSAG